MNTIDEAKARIKGKNLRLVMPEVNDGRIVAAAQRLRDLGLAEPLVLGHQIGAASDQHIDVIVRNREKMSRSLAARLLKRPLYLAAAMVATGEVNAMVVRPALVYEHQWQPRDLMIWDNRSTLHQALPYDEARERRVVRRCTVIGDIPQ